MVRYGYHPMTPANALIDGEQDLVARERSRHMRDQAWQALERDNFRDYCLRRHRSQYIEQLWQQLSIPSVGSATSERSEIRNVLPPIDAALFNVDD